MPYPANSNWNIDPDHQGLYAWSQVTAALLMDIRRELQILNRLLGCPNFVEVPEILRKIRRNTTKPRRKQGRGRIRVRRSR